MRWRLVLVLVVLAGLAPGLLWRAAPAVVSDAQQVMVDRLALPVGCCSVGPIRVDAAWHVTSPNTEFGGYSALVVKDRGRLLALSDNGLMLDMAQPAAAGRFAARIGAIIPMHPRRKGCCDLESATWDPVSQRLWFALEGRPVIERRRADLSPDGGAMVPALNSWPGNKGPEAMVRLRDGRFIVLGESFAGALEMRRHPALSFAQDPLTGVLPQSFTFVGTGGYRPTDMAQLPDGRVLIVMRQLRWPLPLRVGARLMLADPAEIRSGREWHAIDLGEIAAPVPVDNFEGLALVPESDGSVTGWLISDDNLAALQRTIVLRLRIDPARLPRID